MKVVKIWEKGNKVFIEYKLTKYQFKRKGFWRSKNTPCHIGYYAIHDVDKWIIGHYNGGGIQLLRTIKIIPKTLTVIQSYRPFTKKEVNSKGFAKKFVKVGREIMTIKEHSKPLELTEEDEKYLNEFV